MPQTSSHVAPLAHHRVLSLAVFPGAGQWAQGRKMTATILMVLFSIATAGMFYFLIVPTVSQALHLIRIGDHHTPLRFEYMQAIPWGAASMILYLINAWDICRPIERTTHPGSETN